MAFTVEDGTGLVNATSLADVAFADEYFADVDNTVWSGLSLAAKEQNLIKATRFFEQRYVLFGKTKLATQALSFPRTGIADTHGNELVDQVPDKIKNGIVELALISNSEPLFFTPSLPTGTGGQVIETKQKVGSLEEVIKYLPDSGASAASIERQLPNAEFWFRGFVQPPHDNGSNTGGVFR